MRRAWILGLLVVALAVAGCASDQGGDPYGDGGGAGDGAGADDDGPRDGNESSLPEGVDARVELVRSAYEPQHLEVQAGETVQWFNQDGFGHTVTIRENGTSERLHDATLEGGESTRFTFESAGEYEVWCRFHGSPGQGMYGSVTVS